MERNKFMNTAREAGKEGSVDKPAGIPASRSALRRMTRYPARYHRRHHEQEEARAKPKLTHILMSTILRITTCASTRQIIAPLIRYFP